MLLVHHLLLKNCVYPKHPKKSLAGELSLLPGHWRFWPQYTGNNPSCRAQSVIKDSCRCNDLTNHAFTSESPVESRNNPRPTSSPQSLNLKRSNRPRRKSYSFKAFIIYNIDILERRVYFVRFSFTLAFASCFRL